MTDEEKRAALNKREADALAADRERNPKPCAACMCPMHKHTHETIAPGDLTPCGTIEFKLGACTGCECMRYVRV